MIRRIKSVITLVALVGLTAGPALADGLCTPQTPVGEPCYPEPEPVPWCTPQTPPGMFCVPRPTPPASQVVAVPTLNEYGIGLLILIVLFSTKLVLKPKMRGTA